MPMRIMASRAAAELARHLTGAMADPRDEGAGSRGPHPRSGRGRLDRVSVARRSDPEAIDGLRLLEDLARGFRHTLVRATPRPRSAGRRAVPASPVWRCATRLGRGGQGEVYRAYDPLLDQDVALKLRPAGSDTLAHQFIAEARRLVRVRHANVVSVYGAAMEQGRVGLWMELVRGETWRSGSRPGRLTAEGSWPSAPSCAPALAAVHRHGLVHGDVRPRTCCAGRRARCWRTSAPRGSARPRRAGVSGTLHYLAPQLLQGRRPRRPATCALGVLMYRALAGTFPRQARSLEGCCTSTPRSPCRRFARGHPACRRPSPPVVDGASTPTRAGARAMPRRWRVNEAALAAPPRCCWRWPAALPPRR